MFLQECILPFVKLIIIELFEYFYCIKNNSKCILNNNFALKFLNTYNLLLIKTNSCNNLIDYFRILHEKTNFIDKTSVTYHVAHTDNSCS